MYRQDTGPAMKNLHRMAENISYPQGMHLPFRKYFRQVLVGLDGSSDAWVE